MKCDWSTQEAPWTDGGVGAEQPEDGWIGLDSCGSTDACSDSAAGQTGLNDRIPGNLKLTDDTHYYASGAD